MELRLGPPTAAGNVGVVVARPSAPRVRWMHSLPVDVAMALSWMPFAAFALLWQSDTNQLTWLVSATLLFSFAHQPLTVALVYGDKRNFDLRRRIFTWSPLLFVVAVLVTRHVSLTTLAVVAAIWNAEHTLMQRYGITRIYGRKAGQQKETSRSSCCSRGSRWPSCGWRPTAEPPAASHGLASEGTTAAGSTS